MEKTIKGIYNEGRIGGRKEKKKEEKCEISIMKRYRMKEDKIKLIETAIEK